MTTARAVHWPTITLAWRQRVAAFWLIAWPSWFISFTLLMFLTSAWVAIGPIAHAELLAWASALAFLFCQALFVQRMVRKRYRSFRLEVVREGGSGGGSLTAAEAAQVWLKIIWPQVAFLIAIWLVQLALASRLTADTTRAISTLSLWGRVLVVGPFGIHCAVPADYRGFRLEAFGLRFI